MSPLGKAVFNTAHPESYLKRCKTHMMCSAIRIFPLVFYFPHSWWMFVSIWPGNPHSEVRVLCGHHMPESGHPKVTVSLVLLEFSVLSLRFTNLPGFFPRRTGMLPEAHRHILGRPHALSKPLWSAATSPCAPEDGWDCWSIAKSSWAGERRLKLFLSSGHGTF